MNSSHNSKKTLEFITQNTTNEISRNENSQKLKVILFPHWTDNPYQKLLVEHLEKEDLCIELVQEKSGNLPNAIKRIRPDIIHFHATYPFFLAPSKIASWQQCIKSIAKITYLRLKGIKIVWTVHDLKNHENHQLQTDKVFSKFFMHLSHSIIVHTDIGKQQFITAFNVKDKNKISVIPHGNFISCYENKVSRSESRNILKIPDQKVVILFLGLIRPYKGVPILVDTFKKLSQDNIHLVIAGRIVTEELLEEINKKVEGCNNITFIPGRVPDDKIQLYMNGSDVVVLPYLDIFTSGAAVLAMSFSKACIAPRKGCMEDMLDESGAFLYNPEEAGGLMQALNLSVQQKDILQKMGQYNRCVAEHWNWNSVAKKTLTVYEQCLKR